MALTKVKGKVWDSEDNDLGINVKDYGATGDGSTDDTAAIQAAIDAAPSLGGNVYFPSGIYVVGSALTITSDAVTLIGSGVRSTSIWVTHDTDSGITVEHATTPGSAFINAFGLQNITLRAKVETTANAMLYLNKVQNVFIDNVTIEDHFGGIHVLGGASHFVSNLQIKSPRTSSPVSWTGVKTGSFFVKIQVSSDDQVPFAMFYDNFNFRRTETSDYVENGIQISGADGVLFSNGHIMGVDNACLNLVQTDQITGIKCSNVWFDNNSDYGVQVSGSTADTFGELQLTGCMFLTNREASIRVSSSATTFDGLNISNCVFRKPTKHGIHISGGVSHVITGCDFGACNTSATASTAAITIDLGASNVKIKSCNFDEVGYGVTATSMLGVYINTGATTNVDIQNCSFDLTAVDVTDKSTSDVNVYRNNTTTKSAAISSVTSTTLDLPEIGDFYSVATGLDFGNMSGRSNRRLVTLYFEGVSVITNGSIKLAGRTNWTTEAGDVASFLYDPATSLWYEISRTEVT